MSETWEDAAHWTVAEIATVPCNHPFDPDAPMEQVVKRLRALHTSVESRFNNQVSQSDMAYAWRMFGTEALLFLIRNCDTTSTDVYEILVSKQRDYGPENIRRYGRSGLVIRTHDKVARLENLLESGKTPSNESITDTFIDIVGYSAIGMMWENGTFLLPMGE